MRSGRDQQQMATVAKLQITDNLSIGRPEVQPQSQPAAVAKYCCMTWATSRQYGTWASCHQKALLISGSVVGPAGVKALDTLTPLGRGASLLVIGPHNSGKTTLAVDAILGQRSTGVKCVMSSTTLSAQQLEQRLKVRYCHVGDQHGQEASAWVAAVGNQLSLQLCHCFALQSLYMASAAIGSMCKTASGANSSRMQGWTVRCNSRCTVWPCLTSPLWCPGQHCGWCALHLI